MLSHSEFKRTLLDCVLSVYFQSPNRLKTHPTLPVTPCRRSQRIDSAASVVRRKSSLVIPWLTSIVSVMSFSNSEVVRKAYVRSLDGVSSMHQHSFGEIYGRFAMESQLCLGDSSDVNGLYSLQLDHLLNGVISSMLFLRRYSLHYEPPVAWGTCQLRSTRFDTCYNPLRLDRLLSVVLAR